MACKDKRKVWVQVKTHQRKVLKCFEKPKTKHYNMIDIGTSAAAKTYPRKKKITKPLNLADFTIPGCRRKKEENQKSKEKNRQDTIDTPTQKTSQKNFKC